MPDPYYVPPVYTGILNHQQRAMIAGYLLHYRQMVLNALATLGDPVVEPIVEWAGPTREYYRAAEAYSRYLLWTVGYPVDRNQMYGDLSDAYYP